MTKLPARIVALILAVCLAADSGATLQAFASVSHDFAGRHKPEPMKSPEPPKDHAPVGRRQFAEAA